MFFESLVEHAYNINQISIYLIGVSFIFFCISQSGIMYSKGLMQYMFSHHSRHYLMQHVEVGIPWSTPSFRVPCSFHSVLPSYGSSESATLNQLMGRQRTHVGGYYGLSCKGFMPFLLMSIYVIRK